MTRDLAMAFAAAGFPVSPVDVFWDDERKRWRKVPCIREWESRATTNPILIKMWWGKWPLAVPGIPLGRCGKVVVDADRHPGGSDGVELFHELDRTRGPFPVHPFNYTKSGGEHHWFAQPATPVHWAKWGGGEVLGHGRFVVGYAVPQGECPVLPEVFWRVNGATTTPMGVTRRRGSDRSNVTPMVGAATTYQINYARRALANACLELRQCPEGQRNTKLNALAYKMGRLIVRGWISLERVEDYLLRACEANGLIEDDGIGRCRATLASGISAGMKRPYQINGGR
jgi:hypothetical protein